MQNNSEREEQIVIDEREAPPGRRQNSGPGQALQSEPNPLEQRGRRASDPGQPNPLKQRG